MRIKELELALSLFLVFLLSSLPARTDQVELTGIAVENPMAMIIEIDGQGRLERGGQVYQPIIKAGLGFKKGDVFEVLDVDPTKEEYAVILLNKGIDPSKVSLVRISEGGKIAFLDDDGEFAVRGVYIESSDPNNLSSFVFDINHASSDEPFFIWTPDVVLGVRGTFLEVRPAGDAEKFSTGVIGYNSIAGLELSTVSAPPGQQWDSDDVILYMVRWGSIALHFSSGNAELDYKTTADRIYLASLMMENEYTNLKHIFSPGFPHDLSSTPFFAQAVGNYSTLQGNQLGRKLEDIEQDVVDASNALSSDLPGYVAKYLMCHIVKEEIEKFLYPHTTWSDVTILFDFSFSTSLNEKIKCVCPSFSSSLPQNCCDCGPPCTSTSSMSILCECGDEALSPPPPPPSCTCTPDSCTCTPSPSPYKSDIVPAQITATICLGGYSDGDSYKLWDLDSFEVEVPTITSLPCLLFIPSLSKALLLHGSLPSDITLNIRMASRIGPANDSVSIEDDGAFALKRPGKIVAVHTRHGWVMVHDRSPKALDGFPKVTKDVLGEVWKRFKKGKAEFLRH